MRLNAVWICAGLFVVSIGIMLVTLWSMQSCCPTTKLEARDRRISIGAGVSAGTPVTASAKEGVETGSGGGGGEVAAAAAAEAVSSWPTKLPTVFSAGDELEDDPDG